MAKSTVGVAVVAVSLLCASVLWLIARYAHRQTRWLVLAVVSIGWLLPFSIALLLPLDLSSSIYRKCERTGLTCDQPFMYVDEFALKVAWETIYWTSFCLTWVVLPTLNSYTNTGEFSFFPKLRSALRMNIVYYLCVAVVAISAVVYIAAYHFEWNLQNLLAFLMATSNAYGLFLVVIFMGQGLIQIPRQLWHHADLKWLLGYQEFLAPKFHENTIDDDAEWDQVVKEVAFCHHNIDHQSNLYKYVQILVSKCPKARTEAFYTSIAPPLISQKYLENLHIRLKRAARSKDKNHALYESLLSLAWYCEDAIDEANQTNLSSRIKTFLRFWARFLAYRFGSLVCWAFSLIIIWSEVSFPFEDESNPKVDILAIIVKSLMGSFKHLPERPGPPSSSNSTLLTVPTLISTSNDGMQTLGAVTIIQLISMLTVGYMSWCTFSSLFKLKVFSLYSLVPHHHSDESSLLWFTGYLFKLTFPLCYNFLNLIKDQDDSVFSDIMGKIDLFPAFGTAFHNYVPIALAVYFLIRLLNLHSLILHKLCGIQSFFYDEETGDIENESETDGRRQNEGEAADVAAKRREGRRIIQKERHVRSRKLKRDQQSTTIILNNKQTTSTTENSRTSALTSFRTWFTSNPKARRRDSQTQLLGSYHGLEVDTDDGHEHNHKRGAGDRDRDRDEFDHHPLSTLERIDVWNDPSLSPSSLSSLSFYNHQSQYPNSKRPGLSVVNRDIFQWETATATTSNYDDDDYDADDQGPMSPFSP